MASSGYEKGKPRKKEHERKIAKPHHHHGFTLPNLKAFLFESAFQIITWVCIGACFLSASIFFGKDNMRGVYWSGVFLAVFIVLMLGLIGDRHFFQGKKSSRTQNDPERPRIVIREIEGVPAPGSKISELHVVFYNFGATAAHKVRFYGQIQILPKDGQPLVIPKKSTNEQSVATIEPGMPMNGGFGRLGNYTFTEKDCEDFKTGERVVYLRGRIDYEDVDGNPFWITFSRRLRTDMVWEVDSSGNNSG